MLTIRRSTRTWSVPGVPLVEGDAVSRKPSSKSLQIFGCAANIAVDGVDAVNKMGLKKYELVLMVRTISLPNFLLDVELICKNF